MDVKLRRDVARAKASIRGEGWTVSGSRLRGYVVKQLGVQHEFNERQLLEFAGLA